MDLFLIAGAASTALFAAANLPMVVKAVRTRDLTSYSPASLVLGNAANVVHTFYVLSLPVARSGFCTGCTSCQWRSCYACTREAGAVPWGMREVATDVKLGRRAYANAHWSAAWTHLEAANRESGLGSDDLVRIARSAWWLGDSSGALTLSESAYQSLLADGRELDAAETALQLSLLWLTRGDITIGDAWRTRARRLLGSHPEGRVHGYLLYIETSMALVDDGKPWSDAAVERLSSLAERHPDPVLRSLSLVVAAMSLLRRGDTAEGFALLDEAMLPVVAGHLPGEWAGDVYCTTIHLCRELADFRRMEDWTSATERWCRDFGSDAIYTGVCRVHRLELLSARGQWTDVEERLAHESGTLLPANGWIAGGGFYQLGEIRRLRGDRTGAREAYAAARDAYIDPEPGSALLTLEEGDPDRAFEAIAHSLSIADRLGRVRKLRAAVEIACAAGRPEAAEWCAELSSSAGRYRSQGFLAWASHARGILAVAEGALEGAVTELSAAVDSYRRDRLPYDMAHGLTWLTHAHELLGDPLAAARERAEAASILTRLGAMQPLQIHLPGKTSPRASGREGPGLDPSDARPPLTYRECEVLALVAVGSSNRDVAARLFISEKTVGRHLANVYVKLGVASRTAAAAWWHGSADGAH